MSPTTERTLPLPVAPGRRGPVVVLGHQGLLGQALMSVAAERGLRTLGISRRTVPGVNLARQADLAPFLDPLAPSLVINAAAITDLAACEADASAAQELHARLPGLLADWGRRRSTPWVQVSTDHYWSGSENTLHDETAAVQPPNVYARTKRAGEELALGDPNALVLRTNIVGFRGRAGAPTFVEWALGAVARREPIDAYTDVWASSLEAHQCARVLFELVDMGASGLLHVASHEAVSKADFLAALAHAAGYDAGAMRRVPRPAKQRPRRANTMGLDVSRVEALLQRALPTLDEVVAAVVAHPSMPSPSVRMDLDLEVDLKLEEGPDVHHA